jgi:hypothetical protein
MNALALPPDIAARVIRGEPMSKHTSWHVGGPADIVFQPLDVADVAAFLRSLEPDTSVMWIGLGSNLLVRDGGIRGAVIETHGVFDELERRGDNEIWCGSGVACAKLPSSASSGVSARGVLRGHSGNARRCARDERRRIRRRNLAARARRREPSIVPACATSVRRATTSRAIATSQARRTSGSSARASRSSSVPA